VWVVAQFCHSVRALFVCLIITTSINIMKNRHMFGTVCVPQSSYGQEDLASMNAYSVRISEEMFDDPIILFVPNFECELDYLW